MRTKPSVGMEKPGQTLLIFDLDNTLITSHINFTAVRHRLIDALHEAGAAEAQSREALLPLALADLVAVGQAVSPALADKMWDLIRQAERDGLAHAVPADGAHDVLSALRTRGYRLALLTNNAREMVQEVLDKFGLAEYFDIIATRDDVPALKPAPDGIRAVLSHLPSARHAVMIGDAWIDAQAARDAGIPFVGVGPRRQTIEARGLVAWAWADDLRGLVTLNVRGGHAGGGTA